jgi:hypothetical protein
MIYERPTIERRVEVNGPVITVATAGSAPVTTPTWTRPQPRR